MYLQQFFLNVSAVSMKTDAELAKQLFDTFLKIQ